MSKREPWNPLLKSYPESEKVNSVSPSAEAFFCRLIAKSDDMASYYGAPRLIASYLYGHRLENKTATVPKIAIWRNELLCIGLLKLYVVEDREYIHIVNCKKQLRSDIALDIRFPKVTEENTILELSPEIQKAARRIRQCHPTYHQPNPTQPTTYTQAFSDWWKIYPRKRNKSGAFKAWHARMTAGISEKLLFDCLKNYLKEIQASKTEERFILHAATFLGPSKRYEDFAPGTWSPPPDHPPWENGMARASDYKNETPEAKAARKKKTADHNRRINEKIEQENRKRKSARAASDGE